jgi:tetratricopeptide (TPR) repeat protein
MKKILTIIALIFTTSLFGQVDLTVTFKKMYNEKKYQDIVDFKLGKPDEIPAKALYYKAMAYYMTEQDDNALKYFDMAIEKGPVDYDMFYYKGKVLHYKGKFTESLPYFDKAIELLSKEPDFYAGKGYAFIELNQMDSALQCFEMASKLPKCTPSIFIELGELYQDKKKIEASLSAYKSALALITPTDEDYQRCLFNIGLSHQLLGNAELAKTAFEELYKQNPEDYRAIAKLIQAYFSMGEFDKAKPLKEILYNAYKSKKLPEIMSDKFCFDQFKWNDKTIMAFEFFDEKQDELLSVKHKFYVTDGNGTIEWFIQSESSLVVRQTKGKYILVAVKDSKYSSYWSYKFDEDFDYTPLKAQVLKILNNEIKPEGSTIINGK